MNLKRVSGSSIQAALTEARLTLGQDIVLVEATPATGSRLAEIVVASETDASTHAQRATVDSVRSRRGSQPGQNTKSKTRPKVVASRPEDAALNDRYVESVAREIGYDQDALDTIELSADSAGAQRQIRRGHEITIGPARDDRQRNPSPVFRKPISSMTVREAIDELLHRFRGGSRDRSKATRQRRLHPSGVVPAMHVAAEPSAGGSQLHQQLHSIDRRIGQIEDALDHAIIGHSARWFANPLYSEMVNAGYSLETATAVLAQLSARHIPADADEFYLRRQIVEALRSKLNTVVARKPAGAHMFVGLPGAGKTSLIAKLSKDHRFCGSKRVLVLLLRPVKARTASTPEERPFFEQHGIDAMSIRSAEQLQFAADVLDRYDTLLIDTPSLSRGMYSIPELAGEFATLTSSLRPLTTHYVVDVRHDLSTVAEDLNPLPITIDAVALTHLDGLKKKGRLVEFLLTLNLPIYFASRSCDIDTGACTFSPAELAAESVALGDWPYSDDELRDYFGEAALRRSPPDMSGLLSDSLPPMQLIGNV